MAARQTSVQGIRNHPMFKLATMSLDDKSLQQAERLGNQVMKILDGKRLLPPNVRQAIAFGIGVQNRGRNPEQVVKLIRTTIASNGAPVAIGLTQDSLDAVRHCLAHDKGAVSGPATNVRATNEKQK